MADTAARLALRARRYEVLRFSIAVIGIDLTGVAMNMQVRLQRGTPGAPLIALGTVTTASAEGLKLDSVTTTNGVPTSIIKGRINQSTMTDATKVPYAGEVGADTVLAYAMQWTLGGDARNRVEGDFIVVDSAYGSDNAPTTRAADYGSSSRAIGGSETASLAFGDQIIQVSIADADLLAPIAASVSASAAQAAGERIAAQAAADLSRASARAASFANTNPNLFTRRELAFEDLSRLLPTIGFSVGSANGSPVGVLLTPAGGPSALVAWRMPVSVLNGAPTFAVSAEIVSATTAAAVSLQARQYRADGTEIMPRTTVVAAAPGVLGTGGIAVDPACAFIQWQLGQSGTSTPRTAQFRSMLLAWGGEFGFRQPPVDPASDAETAAGTNASKYVSPATLKQAAPALIDTRLTEAGLTPDIVDYLIQQSAIEIPVGLGWPSRWPKTVIGRLLSGGYDFFKARALARTLVPPETWTAAPIYVDPDGGNNANSGATMAAAFKTVPAAVAAGIARGGAIHLIFKAGAVMPRASSFTNVAWGSLNAPLACTVEGGGSVVSSNHDVLTWAVDATYPNLWSATRSGAGKVFDPSVVDADGLYAPYAAFATPTALNAAGAVTGYAADATKVYARRADASAVTNANCRVFLAVVNFEITGAKASVYLEGIRFEGSSTGPVHFESTNDVNFAAVDCFAGYTTRQGGSERDAFRLRNLGGLTLVIDPKAGWVDKDAFNQHVDIGTSRMPGIWINPQSRHVGTAEGGSKNAFTLHETARAIVVNPDFPPTINGSTIANVGDSKCIVFGGTVRADAGSGAGNGAVELTDNAELWFVGTEIIGDIVVSGNTTVYLRDVTHTGAVVASGNGKVVEF